MATHCCQCVIFNNEYVMKHLLSLILAAMLVMAAACSSDEQQEQQQPPLVDISSVLPTDTVYMCTGSGSKRFHSSDTCAGVEQCTKEIIAVTRAEAEKRHRSFCQRCYQDTVFVKKVKK